MAANSTKTSKSKKGFNPIRFFKEVKIEARKITWPTRQETTVSVIAVFIMVIIAATFLYFADQIIAWAIRFIMGF
ncbi:MAG: preprotein translocase subunit SecE [Alphaproteobacteria bacterium]|nr:preprotein translocase subunit SecE [Alphaproteobacteria bacterium]